MNLIRCPKCDSTEGYYRNETFAARITYEWSGDRHDMDDMKLLKAGVARCRRCDAKVVEPNVNTQTA
jgi:hypothetical protein